MLRRAARGSSTARGTSARSTAFVLAQAPKEAALQLEQEHGKLLVTCESVRNWTDLRLCSLAGVLAARVALRAHLPRFYRALSGESG